MNVPSGEISSLEPAQRAVREAAGRVIGGFGAEALDDFRSAIAPRQRIEEPSAGDGRSPTQGRASSPPSPARLLIVDDHPLVREGMRAMLAGEPDLEVIGEAQNGQEAIESCCRLCPKLVLMGVGMPKMEGIEATRAIKTECPATSVLILAAHKNPDHFLHAVRAGAAGYVLKDATNHQLMSAVRKVLVGEFPLNQELAMRLLRRLSTEEKTDGHTKPSIPEPPSRRREEPLPHSPTDSLTDREIEVLRLLALGKTNREVAQDLWVSLSTVKFHVHRLFGKLGVSDRTQAAVRAVELGLLADQEEEGYP